MLSKVFIFMLLLVIGLGVGVFGDAPGAPDLSPQPETIPVETWFPPPPIGGFYIDWQIATDVGVETQHVFSTLVGFDYSIPVGAGFTLSLEPFVFLDWTFGAQTPSTVTGFGFSVGMASENITLNASTELGFPGFGGGNALLHPVSLTELSARWTAVDWLDLWFEFESISAYYAGVWRVNSTYTLGFRLSWDI